MISLSKTSNFVHTLTVIAHVALHTNTAAAPMHWPTTKALQRLSAHMVTVRNHAGPDTTTVAAPMHN